MKLIAHRANTNGPNSNTENNPDKIIECIENGYDVEVDIRYDIKTDTLWLGHDTPEYMVNWWWLAGKADHLWIHCKDIQTLHEFSTKTSSQVFLVLLITFSMSTKMNFLPMKSAMKHIVNRLIEIKVIFTRCNKTPDNPMFCNRLFIIDEYELPKACKTSFVFN